MISLTPNGRRAEEFHALLESGDATDRERDVELLQVVGALRSAPEVNPRPAYAADLRERLMAEAEVVLSQVEVERKLSLPAGQQGRRDRRVAIAAGAIALVGVSSSVAFASQGALPGDALYPIKRAIEGASTSLTFDDVSKGDRLLDNASGRLVEVEKLAQRSSTSEEQFRDTLGAFTSQSEEAAELLLDDYSATGSSRGVETLREFAGDSIEKLSVLSNKLPAGARDALETAVNSLATIDSRAQELCPGCSGGITDLPRNLAQFAASEIPLIDVPASKPAPAPPATEQTYTDEGADVPAPEQQGTVQTDPTQSKPPQQTEKPDPSSTDKKPAVPELKDATKGLTDLLVSEDGLLGSEGLVGGLLGGLLGPNGLLGGGSSDD